MRRAGLALLAAAAFAGTAPAQTDDGFASFSAEEPRAFGYAVGDKVVRTLKVDVPAGQALDADSVPQPGGRGKSIELHSVRSTREAFRGGTRHVLRLEYQVFLAPAQVRTLELPALSLRVTGGGRRDQSLRVEPWPVTVAPLVPVDVSPRHGLGEMRPDAGPPPIDTAAEQRRLALYGAGLGLLALYLLHVYVALPWWGRQGRPFTRARQVLRAWPRGKDAPPAGAAFRHVHEALNASAGEVLFAQGLDRFIARRPQFAPLRADFAAFFERSSTLFFARGTPESAQDLAWLVGLCERASRAERGVA